MGIKELKVCLWGVRGTMTPDCPSTEFGIHTTAFEFRTGNGTSSLFVDMGTGISPAVRCAMRRGQRDYNVFMTHLHLDHVNGTVTFVPFYSAECRVRIYGMRPASETEAAFRALLGDPFHPVDFSTFSGNVGFEQIIPSSHGIALEQEGVRIYAAKIPHPQGALAYRVDDGENAIVVAPDIELAISDNLDAFRKLVSEPFPAGLVVIDGFFLPEEIDSYALWGHSSWSEARQMVTDTGAGKLLITHHKPSMTDHDLLELEASVPPEWARERDVWRLAQNQAVWYEKIQEREISQCRYASE